jgi:ABC-type iron transport system FetAB ATPase subunit
MSKRSWRYKIEARSGGRPSRQRLATATTATIHDGELKRYAVLVRCTSHRNIIWNPEVLVFATNAEDAKAAAVEKMIDKYLRHQSKRTTWITVGEPKEC